MKGVGVRVSASPGPDAGITSIEACRGLTQERTSRDQYQLHFMSATYRRYGLKGFHDAKEVDGNEGGESLVGTQRGQGPGRVEVILGGTCGSGCARFGRESETNRKATMS